MSTVTLGAVQLNVGSNIEENLAQAGNLIKDAAKEGAEFIFTPENTDFMARDKVETDQKVLTAGKHPGVLFFSELAKAMSVWLLIGSMKIRQEDGTIANRSFLFRNTGQLAATYDKIHMFDVDLPDGETHKESETFASGNKAVIVNTPWKRLGMSVCYDVRFPNLYRQMAQGGAEILSVPSAFTAQTGKDHWETLLRARAIETGSYLVAPAQVGDHPGGRKTYGHSMIIDPWGRVIAEDTNKGPGFITRKIDFLEVTRARSAIPSLQHDRPYDLYTPKDLG